MHTVLGLAVLWLLWRIYSDGQHAAHEQSKHTLLAEARDEVKSELRHLEQRVELEELQLEVEEQQFELEQQRLEADEDRCGGRRFHDSRAKLDKWQRTIEYRHDELAGMRKLMREIRERTGTDASVA